MMNEHKRPEGGKDTVTTSFSLDEEVVELVRKWQYITGLSRNEVLNAVSVWILLKEGSLVNDLSTRSFRTLMRFVEGLGLEGVNLEYRVLLQVLVRVREAVDRGELALENPLVGGVTQRLWQKELFTAFTRKKPEDLERVEGNVEAELLREFPNFQKHFASIP